MYKVGIHYEPLKEQQNRVFAIGWDSSPGRCYKQSVRSCPGRVLVNIYKEAWLAEQMKGYYNHRKVGKAATKVGKARGKITGRDVANIAAKQKAQGVMLKGAHQAFKYAARSQIKGNVGRALRVGGRVGLRAVPFVGTAMLAYDIYQLGSYLLD